MNGIRLLETQVQSRFVSQKKSKTECEFKLKILSFLRSIFKTFRSFQSFTQFSNSSNFPIFDPVQINFYPGALFWHSRSASSIPECGVAGSAALHHYSGILINFAQIQTFESKICQFRDPFIRENHAIQDAGPEVQIYEKKYCW